MLSRVIDNTSCCNLNKEDLLREVTVKIELEWIDIQERIIMEVLLNSRIGDEFRVCKEARV